MKTTIILCLITAVLAGCAAPYPTPTHSQALYQVSSQPDVPGHYDAYGNALVGWAPEYYYDLYGMFNGTGHTLARIHTLYDHEEQTKALAMADQIQGQYRNASRIIQERDHGMYGSNISVLSRHAVDSTLLYIQAVTGCEAENYYNARHSGGDIHAIPGCPEIQPYHENATAAQEAFEQEYQRVFASHQEALASYMATNGQQTDPASSSVASGSTADPCEANCTN